MRFGIGFKVGAAADVLLIEEDLRHGFNRLANGLFQIGFGDPFRMNIDIAIAKVVTLGAQFICKFFCAYAVGTANILSP